MAEHNMIYQQAVYYDIIFDRDVSREVKFLRDIFLQNVGREPRSVLDIACGPGYHALEFARQGIRASGLDLRPEMIQFAQDKAAAEGLSLEWITADMRTYQLDEPVDLTISMFDSADALLTNEDIITHFCCVANNLSSRGIYVLDYSHPCDASITRYGRFIYEGQRDGVRVELIWHPDQSFDLPRGLATSTTEMRIHNADREMISFIDQAQERLVTPQEVSLIATLSGVFEVVGWYGAFDLTQPLDMSPLSRRMIAVLQKLR